MRTLLLTAGLFILLPSVLAIKCYRAEDSNPCPTTVNVAGSASDWFHNLWKPFKDWTQNVVGDDFIDNIGEKLRDQVGIDLTSHENIKEWTKNTISKIGADFDVSNNCYIVYDKETKDTEERGCGALGDLGTFGAKAVSWIQGQRFNVWSGSVCFTKPGVSDKEICMCNSDNCNEDFRIARKAAGIDANARAAICDGEECPLANLARMDDKYDFNSACYSSDNDPTERCFTSDVAYLPQVAKLTRSKRSMEGFHLTNIDGVSNSGNMQRISLVLTFGLVSLINIFS